MTAPMGGLGVHLVELCEGIAGPFAGMQMGDLGAEVIKVEPLEGDYARRAIPKYNGSESALFLQLNRNKRSICLDWQKDEGKAVLLRLLASSDVLVVDLQPGKLEQLALTYEDVAGFNPRLIYCSITPLGFRGPWRDRAADELEVQAMTPYHRYIGELGSEPERVGADITAGTCAMFATHAIMAALLERQKTGRGQMVDVSMLGSIMATSRQAFAIESEPDDWGGFWHSGPYDNREHGYKTKDTPIIFGLSARGSEADRDAAFAKFCRDVGLEALLDDPFIAKHGRHMLGMGRDAQEAKPLFENAFENFSAVDLIKLIHESGGIGAAMLDHVSLFAHPQAAAAELVEEVDHPVAGRIKTTGIPWKFAESPASIRLPPPLLGEHTNQVLAGLGYSQQEITRLRQRKTIL